MKDNLREELDKLATNLLRYNGNNVAELYEMSKQVYEKLTVLKYMEENMEVVAPAKDTSEMGERFEQMANTVWGTPVPESNPNEEDLITSGIDTIKNMVAEMPTEEEEVHIDGYAYGTDPKFVKKDAEVLGKVMESQGIAPAKSLNDKLQSKIVVGLNDRLAFVKHLFNENNAEFNDAISQLNSTISLEKAMDFINTMVKPSYNHWEGKEDYEERFVQIIERKFA